jgi:hypothetical protein
MVPSQHSTTYKASLRHAAELTINIRGVKYNKNAPYD